MVKQVDAYLSPYFVRIPTTNVTFDLIEHYFFVRNINDKPFKCFVMRVID